MFHVNRGAIARGYAPPTKYVVKPPSVCRVTVNVPSEFAQMQRRLAFFICDAPGELALVLKPADTAPCAALILPERLGIVDRNFAVRYGDDPKQVDTAIALAMWLWVGGRLAFGRSSDRARTRRRLASTRAQEPTPKVDDHSMRSDK
jgi:hypothetical protein